MIDDPKAVKQEILGYYDGLLRTAFDGKMNAMPTLNLAIQSKVPVHFRDQLIAPVTEHEIPLSKLFESTPLAFLWSGFELKHSKAKVKWDQLCCPKEEGGLGCKRITEWNMAVMLRHLWAFCKKADTLWIKWVHSFIIKEQCLWTMEVPRDASWTMRKLLGLRHLGQPLIKYLVGNGEIIFLWLDNWHPLGPLYVRFGEWVVSNIGRSLKARVASIITHGDWRWPRLQNPAIQAIIAETPNLQPNSDVEDSILWLPHPSGSFTVKSAWNTIGKRYPIQPWCSLQATPVPSLINMFQQIAASIESKN
ncbi:hypothetical protein RHMOL_Rhmol11G0033800 [Rhododendron molle]|uniref:Uncharacterized protein n=1 Tax=Rhododendron molle TaxID=49168 RepID=A0ACC0LNH1_RHOML|nr:hypothetical protein RHMOL_Rhmol11G0033800 [Rhododendron molle]